jgi:hypothetical protein
MSNIKQWMNNLWPSHEVVFSTSRGFCNAIAMFLQNAWGMHIIHAQVIP